MDFNQLMARMRELDQPTTEGGCGMDSAMAPPLAPMKPDTPPPSMSVNINAQGLDNISDMMKLFQKVNPDMLNPKEPMPSLGAPPTIMSIKPTMPPLKMLPDLDAGNDKMPGGEMDLPPMHDKDHEMMKTLDKDGDGDHDMDDHDFEKKKDKEEAFGNSADASGPDYKGIGAVIPAGNDLNRPKKSFSGKPYRGDNPMAAGAYESKEQLRAGIRAELMQRLAETKGAK